MEYKITLPRFHAGQREIESTLARFNVVACGRRFGKSTYGIRKLIEPALEGYPVAWFAPTYKTLSSIWRTVNRILRPIIQSRNTQEKRLILITGGVIDMWSMEKPDSALGNAYKRIVADEVAVTDNFLYHWNKAIRPMLTDYVGDAFFLSTPKGSNDFYKLWWQGAPQNPHKLPEWRSWQMPTSTNPYIAKSEIEAAKTDPSIPTHIYEQEWLAKFVKSPGGLIFNTWDDNLNVTESADYISGNGILFWGADDGYAGEIDKTTMFPTGESHPRVILLGQLRSNGILAIFAEDWALGELEETQLDRVFKLPYPEPEYVAIDSSAAALRGHFHARGVQTLKSSHSVEEGIKEVRGALAADINGVRGIIVHPRCSLLRYEMENYSKDLQGRIIKKHDHTLDTLRYMWHSLK